MEPNIKREPVDEELITEALDEVDTLIYDRLTVKGRGEFISSHEMLGILTEEYYELIDAVKSDNVDNIKHELLDIAVGAVFAVACLNKKEKEFKQVVEYLNPDKKEV